MSEATATDPEAADEEAPLLSLDEIDVHFETNTGWNPFADADIVQAVDDISLDIGEGDVVVLVGESGSGKTTLGKTAVGLQRPTNGSVRYRGQDIWDAKDGSGRIDIAYPEIRRSLQIVHQDPGSALNPTQTVLDSLTEPLEYRDESFDMSTRRRRVHEVLRQVNLEPAPGYASRYPHQLSGGEKQRVVLTRALLNDPDLILADEAVSALDVSLRIEAMELLLNLQDVFNTSYLFISHNLSNARYLAGKADGRIGIMYLGKLVELGTPEEVLENPKHPYTSVLKWATPSLDLDAEDAGPPPVREIDIPDVTDPPSGCRFHTRCPYGRETCTSDEPELEAVQDGQPVACFRQYDDDHPYWSAEWLDADAAEQARRRNLK
jgi:peptide/nickel transport system ATP-binding protein